MKLTKKSGIFYPDGEIILHPEVSVSWKLFSNKKIPELPPGTPLEIDIYIDEQTLLSGEYGIVWATCDLRQGEVLFNALLVQNIASVLGKVELDEGNLWLIIIDHGISRKNKIRRLSGVGSA
ncbi:MAG: hypothetical protein RQ746_12995, partial [Bacteroidales bacterium]|nr:hypothetical protein [Bacteroidales bacterium]